MGKKANLTDATKLQRYLENSLSIDELMAQLQSLKNNGVEGDMKVLIGYDYGDHWNTQVCEKITDTVMRQIEYSDYHNRPKDADPDEEDECEDDGKNLITAVILKNW